MAGAGAVDRAEDAANPLVVTIKLAMMAKMTRNLNVLPIEYFNTLDIDVGTLVPWSRFSLKLRPADYFIFARVINRYYAIVYWLATLNNSVQYFIKLR